ncbi:PREDICTED: uncharacterized protein LOC106330572 [Brassica oleracea var. oleracea]|uniref:uncharacterized protein LOC106330572 n=1 Tax=Brassica oleracea var. oleracea TaxID=109376 RepID=UPI0006A6EBEA|nr:PREDICTED: uncharacterized protein LOC106330572 [Brassica oleracea var. oleracea]
MDAYLKLVQDLKRDFEFFELTKVPCVENVCADALAALGSKLHDQVKRTIPIHKIEKPSIDTKAEQTTIAAAISEAMDIDEAEPPSQDDQPTDWHKELIDYLAEGLLPAEKWDVRRLKRRSAQYVVMDGELHRWTASKVLLKCISGEETRLVMAETHEGAAGNHSGGRALALKIKNLRFYWPTLNVDCETDVRKCDKCQRHASTLHSPTEFLHRVPSYPNCSIPIHTMGNGHHRSDAGISPKEVHPGPHRISSPNGLKPKPTPASPIRRCKTSSGRT